MELVSGVVQKGGWVSIDGKYFVNCSFTNRELFYTGAEFGWENTNWVDCSLHTQGAAARTLQLFQQFRYTLQKSEQQLLTTTTVVQ
jgi:hypothetical protein